MRYILTKKPKNPTIIQGFPSLGLVSTITLKFLMDHLDIEEIGYIESDRLLPLTAIHKGKLVHPITIHYNKKYNLVLIQSLTEVTGVEWDLAKTLVDISKELKAKEIIVIEGKPSHEAAINVYSYTTKAKSTIPELKEGIIMGVTAAMLLKSKDIPITCLFAEAHSQLPDSEAAAKVVEVLDKYMGLKIDFTPLLDDARRFEQNLKKILQKTRENAGAPPQPAPSSEDMNYFG